MMGKRFLIILLMAVLLETNILAEDEKSQAAPMKPFPTEICELKTKEDLWEKCVGKRVKVKGAIAKTILQPPNLTYPDVSSMGGYSNQNHMDTELGQVGLISQKLIECQEGVHVEGILRIASLVGEDGKSSYQIPYIQVLVFDCK